ncbi:hypothetical protein ACFFX1_35775 [Dactylosporangium sucinum]|uniref:Uncharacterized protein n=1 Tax=Dactylosporangium sucinum TaxID=1424081 RepID=A0A917X6D9_9ACTN|nr:hypothetical protein [Dactylosporangium sucinum]GGM76854.1 hypothetical protein GCM10007977_092930 [Dactylosporangium sucinum]
MDLGTALREYTDGGPPTRLTSAGVLAAGHRARHRRRMVLAAGTVAAVTVTGALVVAIPGDPPPVRPSGPGWTALDPQRFCASDDRADRFTCSLQTAVSRRLPGATFRRNPAAAAGPLEVYRDGDRWTASALVADEHGIGAIGFGISPAAGPGDVKEQLCEPPVCSERTGPHGEPVTVLHVGGRRSYQNQLINVRMYAAGTQLFASATNATFGATAQPGEAQVLEQQEVTRPDVPLTVDDLVAILAVPDLLLTS